MYAGLGTAYKSQFRKMIGATGDGSKKLVIDKESEKNKALKLGITETGLEQMQTQGSSQFTQEYKKKPMLSYFILKTDEIYDNCWTEEFKNQRRGKCDPFFVAYPRPVINHLLPFKLVSL